MSIREAKLVVPEENDQTNPLLVTEPVPISPMLEIIFAANTKCSSIAGMLEVMDSSDDMPSFSWGLKKSMKPSDNLQLPLVEADFAVLVSHIDETMRAIASARHLSKCLKEHVSYTGEGLRSLINEWNGFKQFVDKHGIAGRQNQWFQYKSRNGRFGWDLMRSVGVTFYYKARTDHAAIDVIEAALMLSKKVVACLMAITGFVRLHAYWKLDHQLWSLVDIQCKLGDYLISLLSVVKSNPPPPMCPQEIKDEATAVIDFKSKTYEY